MKSQTKVDKSSGKTIFPSTMEGWATFELAEKVHVKTLFASLWIVFTSRFHYIKKLAVVLIHATKRKLLFCVVANYRPIF